MNRADKKEMRRAMRQAKLLLSDEEKHRQADAVFARIEALPQFKGVASVLMYYSLPDELPTHAVVERWRNAGITVFLPRMRGNDLEIVAYDGQLTNNNAFGVEEPIGEPVEATPDIIIVPGVAFDSRRNRLGRGRGFYDHLLARCDKSLKIGVALTCQIVESVPTEAHDIPLDIIVAPDIIYT